MSIQFELSGLVPHSPVCFDLSDWSQLVMSGTGAKGFLHNFCTNDINRLADGQTCEAFACDVKGKILAHMFVVAWDGVLRLISVPGTAAQLRPHLTKYLLDAPVEISDITSESGLLCLCGTGIGDVLQRIAGSQLPVGPAECAGISTNSGNLICLMTDIVPAAAVLVSGSREAISALKQQLSAQDVKAGAPETFELLRIAAGFPFYGRDLTNADLAQNAARTSRAISFTKGCYLGQEPIARLDAMGHTNSELRGLVIDASDVAVGDSLISGEKEVGAVTSVARIPTQVTSLALAKIRTQHADPGNQLLVRTAQGNVQGTVYWPTVMNESAR